MSISGRIRKFLSRFNRNVFVNCPFDDRFVPCFEALVFTVTACGYRIRCALEDPNGIRFRGPKLVSLIRKSDRSIHDLSRVEIDDKNPHPRFNMPFELGVAMGAKHLGTPTQQKKTAVVMVRRRFELPRYLSDMAGGDQQEHNNDPLQVMRIVAKYLHVTPDGAHLPGPTWLAKVFRGFKKEALPRMAAAARREMDECHPINDYRDFLRFVNDFLREAKILEGKQTR